MASVQQRTASAKIKRAAVPVVVVLSCSVMEPPKSKEGAQDGAVSGSLGVLDSTFLGMHQETSTLLSYELPSTLGIAWSHIKDGHRTLQQLHPGSCESPHQGGFETVLFWKPNTTALDIFKIGNPWLPHQTVLRTEASARS